MPFGRAFLRTSERVRWKPAEWQADRDDLDSACRIIGEESYSAGQDKRFLLDDVSERETWGRRSC